jgi:hypothetical protein
MKFVCLGVHGGEKLGGHFQMRVHSSASVLEPEPRSICCPVGYGTAKQRRVSFDRFSPPVPVGATKRDAKCRFRERPKQLSGPGVIALEGALRNVSIAEGSQS